MSQGFDPKLFLQGLGVLAIVAGILLSYYPEWVINQPVPKDTFRAIERRAWWGLLTGLGILLLVHHSLTPYLLTIAALGFCLTLGVLISRLMGIVLDGAVARQWMWVVVEILMLLVLGAWYLKQRV